MLTQARIAERGERSAISDWCFVAGMILSSRACLIVASISEAYVVQHDPTFLPLRIRQPECPRKLRASTAALDLWC